jgi:hypothetical protein
MSNGAGPEGMMAKVIAGMLDVFGFGCLFLSATGDAELGVSMSFIPDIIGIAFLGGPKLIKGKINKTKKSKGILWTILGEICPFLGDIAPLWSISVWKRKK